MGLKKHLYYPVLFMIYSCAGRDQQLIEEGNDFVSKIESFRSEVDSLPSSLVDIGINETECSVLHYQKLDRERFIIWFGKSLGESKTYHSDTGKWENHDR